MSAPTARSTVVRSATAVGLLLIGGCAAPSAASRPTDRPDAPAVVRSVGAPASATATTRRPPSGDPVTTPAGGPATAATTPPAAAGTAPASAATAPPAVTGPRNSIYCGPSLQDVRTKTGKVVDIIERTGVVELRPPCTSKYGRTSAGELIYAGRLRLDVATPRDNRKLLDFAAAHQCRFYVDDVRFISGDPVLVSAAFDDYADYLYTGLFGIELADEPTVDVLDQYLAVLRQLGDELGRRNAATGHDLPLTDIVRASVNYVVGSDEVIPAIRAALGPHARFSIDAYSTDVTIWQTIMGLFGIVDGRAEPGTAYDIQLTVPISSWTDRRDGSPRSPDVSIENVSAYVQIAAGYRAAGISGVMLFTGFAAADNIHDDHFDGTLLQPAILRTTLEALADLP